MRARALATPIAALVLGLYLAGPARAWPGGDLAAYQDKARPLARTGAIAVKGLARGYHFQIWEDSDGREYTYGPTFRSPDPGRQTGYTYLPHRSLVVLSTPQHRHLVVGETRAEAVKGSQGIHDWLDRHEKALAKAQPAPRGPGEMVARWRRQLSRQPYLELVFVGKGARIYRGSAFGGQVRALYLVPDLADLEETDASASETVGAEVRAISFASDYAHLVLEDLAPYADPHRKALVEK